MTASPSYLTVTALAESLGVDQCKILGWIHRGELRALNVAESATGRPRWRIPADAWQTFQQSRSNQDAPAVAPPRRRRGTGYVMKFYGSQDDDRQRADAGQAGDEAREGQGR